MGQTSDVVPFQGCLPSNADSYLGNPETVERIVRNFMHDATVATSMDEFMAAVDKTAEIFCGMNPDYQTIPDWNTRLQLGVVICKHMYIDHSQDWMTIMRSALIKSGLEVREWAKEHQDDPDEEWRWKVDGLIEYWTSILVGTVDITHPVEDE